MSDPMYVLEEHIYNWDEEDTWTEWDVDKPRTASFLCVSELALKLSKSRGCGMLMLLDFLASDYWSPLEYVHTVHVYSEDSMTATTVIRINNLIRRYKLSYLGLNFFTNQFEDAIGTPLNLGGLKRAVMGFRIRNDFTLFELDEDRFDWHVKSLVAVPPNSRLRKLTLELAQLVPLEAGDFKGSQGVWGRLDSALSGENLQLKTLIIDVFLEPSSNARTPRLVQLQTWLTEICFPEVTAKYFRCNMEETEEREMSALRLWIGDEQFDAKKQ
ncbi:hypothetical protein BDZ89DRAFT_1073578 [Hymenopellis radicata]|nr:hypothetical protein BDZ89DRAFT_1073578 [Hymenopellis radicata]